MILPIPVIYNLKISIFSILKVIYVRKDRVGINICYIIDNIDDVVL